MALTRVRRDILTLQYSVEGEILKNLPLVDVLAQAPLIAHAKFLHHPPRRWITRHVGRVDPMQPKGLEPIRHHGVGRLSAVAGIPVGFPNPIAKLRMGVLLGDPQTNSTQECVVRTPNNGEVDKFTALILLLVCANPLLGHAVCVGMWDVERGRGDLAIPSETLDISGITQGEWSEDQTDCFQCWTFFHNIVLSGAPNAAAQPRPEAEARHERMLEGVAWMPWLGAARAWRNAPVAPWLMRHAPTDNPVA
jgi:hypothetical protein